MKYLLHSAPEVNRHVAHCLFSLCFSRWPMSTFKHLWLNSRRRLRWPKSWLRWPSRPKPLKGPDVATTVGQRLPCPCTVTIATMGTTRSQAESHCQWCPTLHGLAVARNSWTMVAIATWKPSRINCAVQYPDIQVLPVHTLLRLKRTSALCVSHLYTSFCTSPGDADGKNLPGTMTLDSKVAVLQIFHRNVTANGPESLAINLAVAWKSVVQVSITSPCKDAKAIVRALENPLKWEATPLWPRGPNWSLQDLVVSPWRPLSLRPCHENLAQRCRHETRNCHGWISQLGNFCPIWDQHSVRYGGAEHFLSNALVGGCIL